MIEGSLAATGSRVHFYLFNLHRIGGLVAGLFLLILGVSGSVMAFSGEIDSLLHPVSSG